MEKKTRYTMVDRSGRELYHSDSFLGFIGSTVLVIIISIVFLICIAAIVCGIATLL